MKLTTIVGTRPQFVKAAAVSPALAARGIRETLVHTGQHYDDEMSRIFFDELEIRPADHNLGVGSGPHGRQTGHMLAAIEQVLVERPPDMVLVYGDTNSTLAGGLAATKLHIPVSHVEAGLRSFNRRMPEEINRILVDQVSELLFTPTSTASANLRQEGVDEARIRQVGDVMMDAALRFASIARFRDIAPARWGLAEGAYVLATVHRAENTDDPARLRAIFEGLAAVAADMQVIVPVHPRTRHALGEEDFARYAARLMLIPPVGYLEMIVLEKHARMIVTDSGGVQKEAFFFDVPCVTVRDETEWIETIESGGNMLVPPQSGEQVAAAIAGVLHRQAAESSCDVRPAPFGEGDSAERIARQLEAF